MSALPCGMTDSDAVAADLMFKKIIEIKRRVKRRKSSGSGAAPVEPKLNPPPEVGLDR